MPNRGAIRFAIVVAVYTAAALAPRAFGQLWVPPLSSLPTPLNANTKTLFLDFNGDFTASFGPYSNITTPAYDIDGDTSSFSTQEYANIEKIWSGVAEKYSPFNLNVTTVDPGNRNTGEVMAIDIGGDGAWYAPAGGVSSINGFTQGFTTGFAFPHWLGNGNPKYVIEAAAHESGHGFGLRHQSEYSGSTKVQEYSDNDPATTGNTFTAQPTAPIMGVSYYATRGTWWKGTSSISFFNIQDDLQVISRTGAFTNNFGYRPDDYTTATLVAVDTGFGIHAHGVIENVTDVDAIVFHATGGVVELDADVHDLTPMLDLSMKVIDSNGNVIATAATPSLGEFLHLDLSEGDYTVEISSAGSYLDVGQWFLNGFVAPEPVTIGIFGIGMLFLRRRR
jgi:hypothetical protein